MTDKARDYILPTPMFGIEKRFGTFPSDLKGLGRLPNADGSIAAASKNLDLSGYRPTADVAAVPNKKRQQLRGAVIWNASVSVADDMLTERLSFANYDLRLPEPDKLMG